MGCIILSCADDAENAHILCDEDGMNMVFNSVDEADSFSWDNPGSVGLCFRIIDLDE